MADPVAGPVLSLFAAHGSRYEPVIGAITSTTPVEVSIFDGTDSLPVGGINANYNPAVDDVVLIMKSKADLIVVCQIVSGG